MAEESDDLILPILGEIGCTFVGDVKSLSEFKSDQLVQAAAKMTMKIKPDQPLPHRLPKSKAARFRICAVIASAIQELGYQGELGYEKFLYPNAADTRAILVWLMNKLPKSDEALGEEGDDIGDTAAQITAKMKSWYYSRHNPYIEMAAKVHKLDTIKLLTPFTESTTKDEEEYFADFQRAVSAQPVSHSQLPPSLMEISTKEICIAQERQAAFDAGEKSSTEKLEFIQGMMSETFKAEKLLIEQRAKKLQDIMSDIARAHGEGANQESQFTRRTEFEEESKESTQVVESGGAVKQVTDEGEEIKEEDEDAIREKQERRLSDLQEQIRSLQLQIEKAQKKIKDFEAAKTQLEELIKNGEEEVKKLMETYKLKSRTLKLLPDAEKNLERLKKIIEDSKARKLKLAAQWDEFKSGIMEEIKREQQKLEERKSEVRKKVDMIRRMRTEMKQMVQDVRRKDELHKQLVAELNKLPKNINRQQYIIRMKTIMKNLDKQKVQIKAILKDVRVVQKDIISAGGTSARSFQETEKVVFAAAKSSGRKESAGIEAYESLAKLRDGFDSLVKTVEDTGKTKNEIRAYETQIDALEAQNTTRNMQRVADDLKQIKVENKSLTKKLKAIKAQG